MAKKKSNSGPLASKLEGNQEDQTNDPEVTEEPSDSQKEEVNNPPKDEVKPPAVETESLTPEGKEEETVVITQAEFDDLRNSLIQARTLISELANKNQPSATVKREAAAMVERFRNQRIPGEYVYAAWDERHSSEEKAVDYYSDIPFSAPLDQVAREYNARFKRNITEGRDRMKFKPKP